MLRHPHPPDAFKEIAHFGGLSIDGVSEVDILFTIQHPRWVGRAADPSDAWKLWGVRLARNDLHSRVEHMDIVDPLPGTRLSSSTHTLTARHLSLNVLQGTMNDDASCDTTHESACDSMREGGAEDDEPPSTPRLSPPPPSPIHTQFSEPMTARQAAEASRATDFVQSDRTRRFRARVFPDATDAQWNDWKWQLRMRIRDLETLQRAFTLSADERETVIHLGGQLPVGITPYYASLIDPEDADDPIRRTMVPTGGELIHSEQEAEDPLNEDGDMPVEGLVHRYPDRVLFLVTSFCATYCRYCTRSRLVGKTGEYHFNTKQFERALAYIEATPEIRDVLISGGDPLTMNDDKIDWLLTRLRAIPHVEFIRIGSKIPAVLPQRITPNLVSILQKCHPFWMSVHFMHPREVTPEVAQSCGRLVNAGIPLGSQTVLLKGTNDNPETMKALMHNLLKIRVRPYYIYQCDPIPGSSHFRTPVETGLKIIEALRGHTTGYAVPQYVIDGPGGGGKIPLAPEYVVGREGDELILRNYEGKLFRYPDPISMTAPAREKITV